MPYIASMGIYVVSKNVMLDLLREKFPGTNDFGSEVIPGATSIGMRVSIFLSNYLSTCSSCTLLSDIILLLHVPLFTLLSDIIIFLHVPLVYYFQK